jgi:hypothetical protein
MCADHKIAIGDFSWKETSALADIKAIAMKERQRLAAQLREFDDLLEKLAAMSFTPDSVEDTQIPPVVPGRYKGKKLSPALDDYLRARPGFKITFDRVVEDLRIGGADMGNPKRAAQNLKITMQARSTKRSNPLVEWDDHWTMWLSDAALLPPKKRIRKLSVRKRGLSDKEPPA